MDTRFFFHGIIKFSIFNLDVREQRGEEVQIFLVGNKTDLNEKRMVSTDEGEHCAIENKVRFLETSAKVCRLLSTFK